MKLSLNCETTNFGLFNLQIGELYFPCADWTDFGQNIIKDWTNKLSANKNAQFAVFGLDFVDGQYHLICDKQKEKFLVIGIDEHDSSIVFSCIVPYCDFEKMILDASERYGELGG